MIPLISNLFLAGLILILTSWVIPDFDLHGMVDVSLAIILLGIMNFLVRPLLVMLSFPITLVSVGFLTFILNVLLLNVATGLIDGFNIVSWIAAIVAAILFVIAQVGGELLRQKKRS